MKNKIALHRSGSLASWFLKIIIDTSASAWKIFRIALLRLFRFIMFVPDSKAWSCEFFLLAIFRVSRFAVSSSLCWRAGAKPWKIFRLVIFRVPHFAVSTSSCWAARAKPWKNFRLALLRILRFAMSLRHLHVGKQERSCKNFSPCVSSASSIYHV